MSTRDVLRKAKPKVHPCEISSGTVHVHALSSGDRAAYLALVKKNEPNGAPAHEIAILGLCEEDGTASYDAASAKDVAELSGVDGDDLHKIVLKIFEVSGLTKESAEAIEKNS